jgi:dynein heavy chain, axonemal
LFETDDKGLMASLSTVLLQEMEKFNRLLNLMRQFLNNLKLAIAGEIVMSAELDTTYYSMINNLVPPHWSKVGFLSLKPLASWIEDLKDRVAAIRDWLNNGNPNCYWMSGLFFP